jgi:hypothetical protein
MNTTLTSSINALRIVLSKRHEQTKIKKKIDQFPNRLSL